jgi:hypothetical protein
VAGGLERSAPRSFRRGHEVRCGRTRPTLAAGGRRRSAQARRFGRIDAPVNGVGGSAIDVDQVAATEGPTLAKGLAVALLARDAGLGRWRRVDERDAGAGSLSPDVIQHFLKQDFCIHTSPPNTASIP